MPPPEKSVICPIVVGRQPDLARLAQVAERAWAGQGQIALISGEAGIGKSRLVAEARGQAAGRALVLEGHCFEAEAALPYGPLLDLFRGYFAPDPARAERVLAGPFAGELAELFPELHPTPPALSAPPDRQRLFLGFIQALRGLAQRQPLLLILEDLHWSDSASLEFLEVLARQIVAQPVCLLLTFRSDEIQPALGHLLAALDRARYGVEFELRRLSLAEVDGMLRAIFEQAQPVRQDFLEALYQLTEGNPFFIEEVLKSLSMAGDITYAGGQWGRKELGQLRIPRSVQDAIQRRTRQLSPGAQAALRLAAVAGRRFPVRLLQAVLGLPEAELMVCLKALMAAQLVVEWSEESFAFRHALTRQAIYAGLLALERQAAHRALAEALERLHPPGSSQPLEDLSYHFFEAGLWASALDYARRAGERAQEVYAPREALVFFSRALEAGRRLGQPAPAGLLLSRGKARETLGEFEAARADYEAAGAVALAQREPATQWHSLIALGGLWAGRDYQKTGELYRQAATQAEAMGDPRLRAESFNRLGNWLVNVGQPSEGLAAHRQALAIFATLNDEPGLANTYDLLGMASLHAGDQVGSFAEYQQAVRLYRALEHRPGLAAALIGACHATYWDEADHIPNQSYADNRAAAAQALALVRGLEAQAGQAYVLWSSAVGLANHGEFGAALAEASAALALATEIEHRQWMAAAHYALGHLYLHLRQAVPAVEALEAGLRLAAELGSAWWLGNISADLAQAHLVGGALEAAERVLRAAPAAPGADRSLIERRLCVARCHWLLAGEQYGPALALARQLQSAKPAAGGSIPTLDYLQGRALAGLGQPAPAEAALLAAQQAAAARRAQPLLFQVLRERGRLLARQGRTVPAHAAFDQARAVLAALAASLPAAELRASFEAAALKTLPAPRPASAERAAVGQIGGLTRRERQVVHSLAQGKSNREIAEALVLSERTVENHVSHILAKLGLESRLQVAAWAAQRGLGPHAP